MNLPAGYEVENPTAASALPPGYELEEGPSKLESFTRGAANNFPLAPQAIASGEALTGLGDSGGYSKNLADWNTKAAAAKAANPVTYGAGAVTGAAAPLFIPGVGEALEAAPVTGNALLGAANAISNKDLTKDAGQTLKEAGEGAAIGGGLGAISKGIGALADQSEIGDRLAARTTAQALDVNPLAMRKLATKMGTSPEEAITDLGNQANELIPNLVRPLDSANSKFTKILNAHDDAGSAIGDIVDNVTKGTGGALPEADETIQALRDAAANYYQVDGGDLALAKTADKLESLQKAGKLDFDRLSQVKSAIGKGFNKAEPPAGTEDIYGIINDKLQNVVDRLTVNDPVLAPELARNKQIYTVTSRLLPAMSRTAAREVAGSGVGGGVMSKVIPTAIGGAVGGPVGAALGGGAKYLQETIAPDLGKNLAYMAMRGAGKVPTAVKKIPMQELNNFLASKYGNQKGE